MNRDYLNYSMNGPGPEATAWTNEYYQNPGQNNEIKRQMDEVFEQFFRYFAILLVLGVTISTARILQTGLIFSYPVQWVSALGILLIALMRRRVSFEKRKTVFLALGLIYGGVGIFAYGRLGQGFLIMMFVCVFATIGGRTSHGYVVGSLATAITVVAGIALNKGWLDVSVDPTSYMVSTGPWMTASASIFILCVLVAIFLGKIKELWFENIKRVELSEAKYRLLADSATDMIWTINLDKMQLTYVSPSVRKMRGYTAEEAMKLPLEKILTAESLERISETLQEELDREKRNNADPERSWAVDVQSIREDGTHVWEETTMSFIRNKEDRPLEILGITRDITERKQAEKEQEKLQTQLSSAVEMAHLGPWEYDVEKDVFTFNDHFYKIFGTSAQEVGGYNMSSAEYSDRFVYPDDIPVVGEEIRKAIKTTDPEFSRDLEHRILYEDGSLGYITVRFFIVKDNRGRTVRTYGVNQNITQRKRAEEDLREREEQVRLLLESTAEAIFGLDRNGDCTFINPACLRLLGYEDAKELIGKNMHMIIHPSHVDGSPYPVEDCKIYNSFKEEKRIYINNEPLRRRDGAFFPAEIWSHPVYRENEPIGAVVTFWDITDRVRLMSQLQHAQKMEAIGTLAAGIAHDFNNILSPIMIHSEMVMEDLPNDSPLQFNMKEIFKAGERARDMVKQILTFSRKEEGERAVIRITPILKEVLTMLRATLPTTIEIQQDLEVESDTLLADPTQIHQIMLNLGTNAAHAMDQGGILKVRLIQEKLDKESASQYHDLNPGPYLKLTVSDTGMGMDHEIMQRIFEPYFTTKEQDKGTGMGLALVHGIVKSYEGDITVESEKGKGTTFTVYLPMIESKSTSVDEALTQIQRGTESILLVDDEKGVIDAIQPMLENIGYTVTARTSSIEALELFRNKPRTFDLIITDQTMPNMTGKDLVRELRSIRPGIPVILCTGFSEQIDERLSREMDINAFVMKPIVMHEIANTIRDVLNKK